MLYIDQSIKQMRLLLFSYYYILFKTKIQDIFISQIKRSTAYVNISPNNFYRK